MKQIFAALAICLLSAFAPVQEVAEEDRVPIDMRRTTLVVKDMQASLAFYRDVLGMKVISDNHILRPAGSTAETATFDLHFVMLRANNTHIGVLGLMEYIKPKKFINRPDEPYTTGSMVMVFDSPDVQKVFEGARKLPGVTILAEPHLVKFPNFKDPAGGKIDVMVLEVIDPDGFVMEINQVLSN